MIVLDTNVLSEIFTPAPSPRVLAWLRSQPPELVYLTAVTQAEVLFGIEVLPAGKRRAALAGAVAVAFDEHFRGRILPFDSDAAASFGRIVAQRRRAGRPISQADAMIAAIARSHGAALATRDTDDFAGCGVALVNPWTK